MYFVAITSSKSNNITFVAVQFLAKDISACKASPTNRY